MSDRPRTPPTEIPTGSSPSEGRRRLLKAAAAGVPVIATLPSGAALANASVHQCVHEAERADQTGIPSWIPPNTEPGHDHYVRIWAKGLYQNPIGTQNNSLVAIGLGENTTTWYAKPSENEQTGGWEGYTGDVNENNVDKIPVLVLVKADSDKTGFTVVGLFPETVKTQGDSFAVSGSCLCSTDPNQHDGLCSIA